MKLIDANVLLYAVNQDAAQHAAVRSWWEQALDDEDDTLGLCWVVLLAFLRIATNRRVFANPLNVVEAIDVVDQWLIHPHVRQVRENETHWSVLKELVGTSGTGGNLTTDAHLAALAIAHGATLISCDMDFARFPQLRWKNPLDEA